MDLFSGPGPRVRTIHAGQPFLDVLVDALVAALDPARDPALLADALIFVPNRRAGRALMEAFAARAPSVTLPPAIRPLGDVDDDPDVWGPAALDLNLPPAIAPLRRRLEIAQLVQARDTAERGFSDPVRALALADSLAGLLDSAAFSEAVTWDALPDLVENADLAEHWRQSLAFLEIVAEAWPRRLAEDGLLDPGARRARLLERLAAQWEASPPDRAIVIAGSTGSVAAARALMRVAARLPRGCVILPGLDLSLPDEHARRIGPQHPQAALRATVAALGIEIADVRPLGPDGGEAASARRAALREALAPAEATADWLARLSTAGGAELVKRGLAGVRLVETATSDEEAAVCALLLREALETQDRTAALVTPDRGLAARVSAKLLRWGIVAPPSAGTPLAETPVGALLRALLSLGADDGDPIALAALIRHPSCGYDPEARRSLERGGTDGIGLRGVRRWRDLADLETKAEPRARPLIQAIRFALAPLREALAGAANLSSAAEGLALAAEIATDATIWTAHGGGAAASALETIVEHGDGLGALEADRALRALDRLLSETQAPPSAPQHARIAIWGPLEARLQRRDLVILGGLNEGSWPAPPPEDPFLTRGMRVRLGLPDPEARLGLSALDFAHAAASPEVVLTRSKRTGDAPSVASRWIWRLTILARGAGAGEALNFPAEADPLAWAKALDAVHAPSAAAEPRPCPPVAARPRQFAVTRVETLIRDPYAIFARDILKLRPLDGIGQAFGPAQRGIALHSALERFGREGGDGARLLALIEEALRNWGQSPVRIAAERSRLAAAAQAFAAWDANRRSGGWRSMLEIAGALEHEAGFALKAKADRIDFGPEGVEIIDFKTGSPPSDKEVASGLSPQLPLEAAILAAAGFEGAPAARASALVYWKFGGGTGGPRRLPLDPPAAAQDALDGLAGLLAKYRDPAQPYLSKPRAKFTNERGDYDHLARRKEWANAEGEA